ncbi:MAG: hypothetical protein ACRDRA_09015 [Pseudonocardiaceae bacterium]
MRIPVEFHGSVLGETTPPPEPDPSCLAQLKHYHSLMPLAQEARKPVFALKPADGAFGGHAQAAQRAPADLDTAAVDGAVAAFLPDNPVRLRGGHHDPLDPRIEYREAPRVRGDDVMITFPGAQRD